METFTLLFFVLALLIAALLVTQTVRRDIKARERMETDLRHVSTRARSVSTPHGPRALHDPALQQHTHKSPPRML